MASKSFPRKVKVNNVKNSIIKHCVTLHFINEPDLEIKKNWCLENVGLRRDGHPLFECTLGWVNTGPGDWAYEIELGHDQWWFARKSDRLSFMLTFS